MTKEQATEARDYMLSLEGAVVSAWLTNVQGTEEWVVDVELSTGKFSQVTELRGTRA